MLRLAGKRILDGVEAKLEAKLKEVLPPASQRDTAEGLYAENPAAFDFWLPGTACIVRLAGSAFCSQDLYGSCPDRTAQGRFQFKNYMTAKGFLEHLLRDHPKLEGEVVDGGRVRVRLCEDLARRELERAVLCGRGALKGQKMSDTWAEKKPLDGRPAKRQRRFGDGYLRRAETSARGEEAREALLLGNVGGVAGEGFGDDGAGDGVEDNAEDTGKRGEENGHSIDFRRLTEDELEGKKEGEEEEKDALVCITHLMEETHSDAKSSLVERVLQVSSPTEVKAVVGTALEPADDRLTWVKERLLRGDNLAGTIVEKKTGDGVSLGLDEPGERLTIEVDPHLIDALLEDDEESAEVEPHDLSDVKRDDDVVLEEGSGVQRDGVLFGAPVVPLQEGPAGPRPQEEAVKEAAEEEAPVPLQEEPAGAPQEEAAGLVGALVAELVGLVGAPAPLQEEPAGPQEEAGGLVGAVRLARWRGAPSTSPVAVKTTSSVAVKMEPGSSSSADVKTEPGASSSVDGVKKEGRGKLGAKMSIRARSMVRGLAGNELEAAVNRTFRLAMEMEKLAAAKALAEFNARYSYDEDEIAVVGGEPLNHVPLPLGVDDGADLDGGLAPEAGEENSSDDDDDIEMIEV